MSLRVDQLPLGPIETNAYIVGAEGHTEALVVDPSAEANEIRRALDDADLVCTAILITHGHWDHLCAVADLAEITEAPVYMPAGERDLLENLTEYLPPGVSGRSHSPDVLLDGGESLSLAGIELDVLSVPGHSPAHLAYGASGNLLSGDVLFAGSVGRTDLPGADWATLLSSIRMLFERLPADTVVHPGHGPTTTLAVELDANPFLEDLRAERRT